jgi:hypothetical protein
MGSADYWIECECPATLAKWDQETIVSPDTMIRCPHCGGEHRAGNVGRLAAVGADSQEVRWFTREQWRDALKSELT